MYSEYQDFRILVCDYPEYMYSEYLDFRIPVCEYPEYLHSKYLEVQDTRDAKPDLQDVLTGRVPCWNKVAVAPVLDFSFVSSSNLIAPHLCIEGAGSFMFPLLDVDKVKEQNSMEGLL
ncbi:hypothetical protein JD844_004326 [Phrynosoma platyrhinos]|uniref:Uncharacterized protein n=1 Tax=Phrynosoma platyrhinos TaxID=52577 RepID=A0ABQ7TMA1_PHRPL|nr:hypothetical protein JD844_004326 [Phrynosoma platyrhinos]